MGHTSRAFDLELRSLKDRVLTMGGRCEALIEMAARALRERDVALARQVTETDRALNKEEMAIDDTTIEILALRQPVGRDLRLVVMALKVVTDLERIGDEAVNLAERAMELAENVPVRDLQDQVQALSEGAARMVRRALDAFVREDEALARAVLAEDDEVDALYGELLRASVRFVEANPTRVRDGFRFASCAKYLERIADHATNIAEMVVFLVSGTDVRHFGSRQTP